MSKTENLLFVGGPLNGKTLSVHSGAEFATSAEAVGPPMSYGMPNSLSPPQRSLDAFGVILHQYQRSRIQNELGDVFDVMVYQGGEKDGGR